MEEEVHPVVYASIVRHDASRNPPSCSSCKPLLRQGSLEQLTKPSSTVPRRRKKTHMSNK